MPTHYVAQPKLEIEGTPASQELMDDILQISVEESLHLPGMFTLVIQNAYYPGSKQEKPWKYKNLFAIGKSIRIGFTSSTMKSHEFDQEKEGYVIQGEITAMESHFTEGSQAPIIIRGYDVSHRLHRGRYNRSFQNMKDSDIVKKIAGEVGIPIGTVENTSGPHGYGDINGAHGYVFQKNQTNMEFFRVLAARNGFELFVRDGNLYFRKPKVDESLPLQWLKELKAFRVRVTSAEQVSEVEVRGWDYSQKREIAETANAEKVLTDTQNGKGSKTSTSFKGKPPTPKMIVVDKSVFVADQAKTMAQSLFDELGGEFVHADARAEGNPKIRPGKVVEVKDMDKYSGKYYVTETCHLFHERVYTTEFSVRGLRGGDLLTVLSPQTRLQPGQTPLVGVVTDNDDPKGWGRVRVWFPSLTPKAGSKAHTSYWARVVDTGAGPSRGFDCLPEINDEVLVAFENGDIHRPYVIGGVWNGKDKPPENVKDSVVKGKVRLRTFKTRIGHKLQFVEEDKGASKQGVYIETKYGHQISLNDTQKFAEIKTKEGHFVRLDDQRNRIVIKTSMGGKATITMNSPTGEINIKAGTRLTLDAGQIDITATGIVNVRGALIKLN
jgi:phage protein D/phage baseplate assembly protein gpV